MNDSYQDQSDWDYIIPIGYYKKIGGWEWDDIVARIYGILLIFGLISYLFG